MQVLRLVRPDRWVIEDNPRGWDLRCMPWIGPVGPLAVLAIFAGLEIVGVWTVAFLIGNHLRSLPIPILYWLFVVMLVLLKQLLLYFAGCGTRTGTSRQETAVSSVWLAHSRRDALGHFA